MEKKAERIYLGGAIDNVSKGNWLDWRLKCKELYEPLGYEVYIPTKIEDRTKSKYVVERDLEQLRKSDILVANLWSRGYGTIMEISIAKREFHLEVLAVIYNKKDKESHFLKHHVDRFFYDLDDVYDYLKQRAAEKENKRHYKTSNNK